MDEIVIIDYGMGNLRSVQKGFERVGCQAQVTRDLQKIASARGVVLPGVGAFSACMENLRRFGLVEPIQEVVHQKKPFLGICLGFQLLFTESEEFGPQRGLDLLPGRVVAFRSENGLKVPHMGWNRIGKKKETPFLEGISDGDYVYFVHSYFVVPEDASIVATTTAYGSSFVSSIATDHLFASQFHPEKSQEIGLRILANFVRFVERGISHADHSRH
ncbi:MAG: imidazole glycerol phosphate synthase subunit HisH [Deltaproteobacteria bacterium]|nr:imidazole glycerol phosphate synthase subunit HisH [Deltaproteobacteria bacterium]